MLALRMVTAWELVVITGSLTSQIQANINVILRFTRDTSGVASAGGGGGGQPQSRKIRMMVNEGPITGCLIHTVTKYRGYKDPCVRLSFQFYPFSKTFVII